MMTILTHSTLSEFEAPPKFLFPDNGKALLDTIHDGSFQPEKHKFCVEHEGSEQTVTKEFINDSLRRVDKKYSIFKHRCTQTQTSSALLWFEKLQHFLHDLLNFLHNLGRPSSCICKRFINRELLRRYKKCDESRTYKLRGSGVTVKGFPFS